MDWPTLLAALAGGLIGGALGAYWYAKLNKDESGGDEGDGG